MDTPPTIELAKEAQEISSANLATIKFSNEYTPHMLSPLFIDYKSESACGHRAPKQQYWEKKKCEPDEFDETAGRFVVQHGADNLKHFRQLRQCYRGRLDKYIHYNTRRWPLLPDGSPDSLSADALNENSTHLHEIKMAMISMIRCANCYSRRRARPSTFDIDGAVDRANQKIVDYWTTMGYPVPSDVVFVPYAGAIANPGGFQRSCPVKIVNPKPRDRLKTTIGNLETIPDEFRNWKNTYNAKMKTLRGTKTGPPKKIEKEAARNSANRHILTTRAVKAKKNAIQAFKTSLRNVAPNASFFTNTTRPPAEVVYNRVKSLLNETRRAALPNYKRITLEDQTLNPTEMPVKRMIQNLLNTTRRVSRRTNNGRSNSKNE